LFHRLADAMFMHMKREGVHHAHELGSAVFAARGKWKSVPLRLQLTAVMLCLVLAAGVAMLPVEQCFAGDQTGPNAIPPVSIYELPGKWTTDAGEQITLAALNGQPSVLALFYTSCEMTCPKTIEALKGIESKLAPNVRERLRFVLVTIDQAMDTPKVLHRFRREHHLQESHWMLLRGSPQATFQLAEALGVSYDRGNFNRLPHSSQISLLDLDGKLVMRQTKVSGDFRSMLDWLRQRLGDPAAAR
jgi:protein SCO1